MNILHFGTLVLKQLYLAKQLDFKIELDSRKNGIK